MSAIFETMGADIMRWQYCAQPPNQNLLFGFGPATILHGLGIHPGQEVADTLGRPLRINLGEPVLNVFA